MCMRSSSAPSLKGERCKKKKFVGSPTAGSIRVSRPRTWDWWMSWGQWRMRWIWPPSAPESREHLRLFTPDTKRRAGGKGSSFPTSVEVSSRVKGGVCATNGHPLSFHSRSLQVRECMMIRNLLWGHYDEERLN